MLHKPTVLSGPSNLAKYLTALLKPAAGPHEESSHSFIATVYYLFRSTIQAQTTCSRNCLELHLPMQIDINLNRTQYLNKLQKFLCQKFELKTYSSYSVSGQFTFSPATFVRQVKCFPMVQEEHFNSLYSVL